MTLEEFKDFVKTGKPLDTPEIHQLMDDMSNEARRITFRLNAAYHTPAEVRSLLSELFGYPVPDTLRVFPPRSTRTSGRTSTWAKAYSSMPAAISRTTEA